MSEKVMEMTRICDVDDVTDEEVFKVTVEGHPPLGVTRADGKYYVFPDKCPHANESLAKGWVEDGRVVCPVHFAEFELGTGEAHNRPTGCGDLQFFECAVRENGIFAKLS